jgi:archaellum component FlaC
MNDELPTKEQPQARSFEERLFAKLDAIEARLGGMEMRLERVENELSEVKARVSVAESRLGALEEKVDARLRETRPIWEGVLLRLDGIEKNVDDIKRYYRELYGDIIETRSRVTRIEDRLDSQTS